MVQYGDLAFEKEAIFVTYAGLQKLVSQKSAQGNVGFFVLFHHSAADYGSHRVNNIF